jgi:hypothetical protein
MRGLTCPIVMPFPDVASLIRATFPLADKVIE